MGKEKSYQNKISKLENQQLRNIKNPEEVRKIQGKIDTLRNKK